MKQLMLLKLGVLLFVSGCSSTQYIEQADFFGHSGRATLVTKDREKVKIMGASKTKDSLVFASPGSARDLDTIPLAEVERITIKNGGRGALEGAGLGFVSGFFSIFILSSATCQSGEGDIIGCPGGLFALVGVLGGLVFGVPIGAITGGIIGHRTHYVFGELPVLDTSKTFTKFRKRQVHKNRRGGLADDK